jgi:hypothetical protein
VGWGCGWLWCELIYLYGVIERELSGCNDVIAIIVIV